MKCSRCDYDMDFRNDCFLVYSTEEPDLVEFQHWVCPKCGEEVVC